MPGSADNSDPKDALAAAVARAQAGDFSGLGAIVDALTHDDQQITVKAATCCRMTSVPSALLNAPRDKTGEDFGTSSLPQVIAKWESWWAKNKARDELGRRYYHSHPFP